MYDNTYHGYWFFSLREDKVLQTEDLLDEYTILNCPQEYVGPFKTQRGAELYKSTLIEFCTSLCFEWPYIFLRTIQNCIFI